MTVRQASLPELIDLAAANGFTSTTTTTRLYERAGVSDTELRRRLDDAGVRIGYIDGLTSPLPGTPEGATEAAGFDMADALGTTLMTAVPKASAMSKQAASVAPSGVPGKGLVSPSM